MIICMFPMALGLGEGASRTRRSAAPSSAASSSSTVVTLFVVPVFYSLFRGVRHTSKKEADPS